MMYYPRLLTTRKLIWSCSLRNVTTKCCNNHTYFLENIRNCAELTQIDPMNVLAENNPKFHKLVRDQDARHFIFGTLSDTIFPWEVYLNNPPCEKSEKRVLWAVLHLNKPGQWPKLINVAGTFHGGAIATVIDGAAGILFASSGYRGMTASISVNYRKPIPLPSIVLCKAYIDKVENRKVYISVNITNGDEQFGTINGDDQIEYVQSDALFIKFKK